MRGQTRYLVWNRRRHASPARFGLVVSLCRVELVTHRVTIEGFVPFNHAHMIPLAKQHRCLGVPHVPSGTLRVHRPPIVSLSPYLGVKCHNTLRQSNGAWSVRDLPFESNRLSQGNLLTIAPPRGEPPERQPSDPATLAQRYGFGKSAWLLSANRRQQKQGSNLRDVLRPNKLGLRSQIPILNPAPCRPWSAHSKPPICFRVADELLILPVPFQFPFQPHCDISQMAKYITLHGIFDRANRRLP